MLLFVAEHDAGLGISVGGLVREISALKNTNKNPRIKDFDFWLIFQLFDVLMNIFGAEIFR